MTKSKRIHFWTEEEKNYLEKITPGRHHREILDLMNEKFDYQFTLEQVKSAISRWKFITGFTGRFEKGNVPFNKGKKGVNGFSCTSFKPGHIPDNYRPVNSERIDRDGYVLVKIADPNIWRYKHRLIYEKHYGKIPKGYSVIFADRNRLNFDINNLMLVSRKELLVLNKMQLIFEDADLTKTGLNVVKLKNLVDTREKEK